MGSRLLPLKPKAGSREARGLEAFDRMTTALSCEVGIPLKLARQIVKILYRLMRDEIEFQPRFVIPGTLIVRKRHEEVVPRRSRWLASIVIDKRASTLRYLKRKLADER